jgi:hypothetical protein
MVKSRLAYGKGKSVLSRDCIDIDDSQYDRKWVEIGGRMEK